MVAPPAVRRRAPTTASSARASTRRLATVLLREKTTTLFKHFPAALTGDEEALHQVRVWGRRLRVGLGLLAGKPKGRRSERARQLLATLTRVAGSARDLDVLLATFDERLAALPTRTAAQRRLRQRLVAARRRGRARMVTALLDLPIARLRAELATIHQRFRATCERESGKLLDGFVALGALLDVMALHGLRRRARRVRYAVEINCQIAGGSASATKPWKELQDRIGVLHDHHVLAEWLDRQARADASKGQHALAAAATAEAAWARQTMTRLHDEYLAAAPGALVRAGLAAAGFSPSPTPT
jgi:CHAD domain-containing protein